MKTPRLLKPDEMGGRLHNTGHCRTSEHNKRGGYKMKIVNKKSMDELIRISKKYWSTGDTDILPARIKFAEELSDQAFGNDYNWCSFSELVNSAVKFNKSITNETIYMMFALAGISVDEEVEA